MALQFRSYIPTRSTTPSGDYPYGTFQDKTGLSNNGTPVADAYIWKNYDGFFQALLTAGKITPNDVPDTATASQYLEALNNQYGSNFRINSSSATDSTKGDYPFSYMSNQYVGQLKGPGDNYNIGSYLTKGGILFAGVTTPGDRNVNIRTAAFDVTGQTMFSLSDSFDASGTTYRLLKYIPTTKLVLTGIPKTARIYSVRVEMRQSGDSCKGTNMAFDIDYQTGAWPILDYATGLWATSGGLNEELTIYVDFDPTNVD